MPITVPEKSPKRELGRKMLDAILSGVPVVGGPLAALYSVTHPAKGEIDLQLWQEEISKLVNSVEEAVSRTTDSIVLSESSATVGRWMSGISESGYMDIIEYKALVEKFPEATKVEILEAIGELEIEGMVTVAKVLGRPFSHVQLTHKLYEVFDPIVFDGANPRRDAAKVADRMLATEDSIMAPNLAKEFGWSFRRMNPALSIVGEYIDPGRKSTPMGQPFAIQAMFMDPRERAQLRRFVNLVTGD